MQSGFLLLSFINEVPFIPEEWFNVPLHVVHNLYDSILRRI